MKFLSRFSSADVFDNTKTEEHNRHQSQFTVTTWIAVSHICIPYRKANASLFINAENDVRFFSSAQRCALTHDVSGCVDFELPGGNFVCEIVHYDSHKQVFRAINLSAGLRKICTLNFRRQK